MVLQRLAMKLNSYGMVSIGTASLPSLLATTCMKSICMGAIINAKKKEEALAVCCRILILVFVWMFYCGGSVVTVYLVQLLMWRVPVRM